MDRTVVIRGLTRILTKADNHDNGVTYEVSLYRDEYDAIEEAIRLLEAESKWIPCSKEMPDEYEPVLTYTNRGDIRIMEYGMEWNGFMWKDEADYLHDIDFVQAWMPLPEWYKVEE